MTTECWGKRAGWIQETARGLAKIKGSVDFSAVRDDGADDWSRLNLVCVRPAILYGKGVVGGLTTRVLIGELYKFKNEGQMDFLCVLSLAFIATSTFLHRCIH